MGRLAVVVLCLWESGLSALLIRMAWAWYLIARVKTAPHTFTFEQAFQKPLLVEAAPYLVLMIGGPAICWATWMVGVWIVQGFAPSERALNGADQV
jgi:hypothetical protein